MRHAFIFFILFSLGCLSSANLLADNAREELLKSIEEAKNFRSKVSKDKRQQLDLYISQLEKLLGTHSSPGLNQPIKHQNLKISFTLCDGSPKNPNVFFGPVRPVDLESGSFTELQFSVDQANKVNDIQQVDGDSTLADQVKDSLSRSLFNPADCMRARYEWAPQ